MNEWYGWYKSIYMGRYLILLHWYAYVATQINEQQNNDQGIQSALCITHFVHEPVFLHLSTHASYVFKIVYWSIWFYCIWQFHSLFLVNKWRGHYCRFGKFYCLIRRQMWIPLYQSYFYSRMDTKRKTKSVLLVRW